MNSEASLNRTVLAVTSIGRWEYFVHLSCFLLYVDILLVLDRGITIGDLSLAWIRDNVTLSMALVSLVGYGFTRSFLLPIIDALNVLAFLRPALEKTRELPRDQIDVRSWWTYSILTRNSPAYNEIDRIREKNEARNETAANCRHLCLFFVADLLSGLATSGSLTLNFIVFANSLSGSKRLLLLASIFLVFFAFGLYALLAPLVVRLSIWVESETLRAEVKRTLEVQGGGGGDGNNET